MSFKFARTEPPPGYVQTSTNKSGRSRGDDSTGNSGAFDSGSEFDAEFSPEDVELLYGLADQFAAEQQGKKQKRKAVEVVEEEEEEEKKKGKEQATHRVRGRVRGSVDTTTIAATGTLIDIEDYSELFAELAREISTAETGRRDGLDGGDGAAASGVVSDALLPAVADHLGGAISPTIAYASFNGTGVFASLGASRGRPPTRVGQIDT